MKYFTGSRRRVRKSTSILASNRSESVAVETENADTSNQVPNSPENERVQRKRSSTNRAELEESRASESKKRKAQNSSSRGRTQKSKTKPVKKATDQGESVSSITAVAQQRSKHHNQSNQMSTSDSDGSLNMSDKRDSLILHDTDEHQNDRSFLQQQIKILKTPFQLEEDCPALANIRANDSKHIPLEIIHNTLRKVNHKTEDEILRSLNRHAQRKLLSNLQSMRQERDDHKATSVSDEQSLERYKEMQSRVAELEKAHDEIKQQHAQYKNIGLLVSQLEEISEAFNSKKLIEEVKRTNNLGLSSVAVVSDSAPPTHQELVKILFKD